MNARVPFGIPSDWWLGSPIDFAFGITTEPVHPDPCYPRNPSGWYNTSQPTTLQGRRPDGLRDPWWLRAKARRKTARAARRKNRAHKNR